MNELIRLRNVFEDKPLTTLTVHGRPAWIAREVGAAIGYAQRGKRFATKISGDWSNEFMEGQDYQVLSGSELRLFNKLWAEGTGTGPFRSNRGLLILFESGLHLALVKTHKPEGVRLRRFLADQVLPQLVRTGEYSPDREVIGGVVVSLDLARPVEGLASRREARLAQQAVTRERWVDLCDRKLKVGALHRVIDRAPVLSEEVVAALEVSAAEIALGADLGALKPETERWVTPSEIAKRWGVSPQKVGRIISSLRMRGDDRFSKRVLTKAKHVDRVVVSFLYNSEGEALIDGALGDQGDPKDAA